MAWSRGDGAAFEQLVPLVTMSSTSSRGHMGRERACRALHPTALVNEVFLRLIEINRVQWQNRAHFFAMAGRLMRRILVDFARARGNQKRGGGAQQVSLTKH